MDETLVAVHRRNNQATRHASLEFSAHRKELTRRLLHTGASRLAVLGAGNGNDLHWPALLKVYREIHVFDIDEQALCFLKARLRWAGSRVVAHAPLELTGLAHLYQSWQGRRIVPQELQWAATQAVAKVAETIVQSFEAVVSPCVLSQLMHSARVALGARHPDLRALAVCQQLGHLRLMAQLLCGGGLGWLVTDVASNDDVNLQTVVDSEAGARTLAQITAAGRCFTGTDPLQSVSMLQTDATLSKQVQVNLPLQTWTWRLSQTRVYLVAALSFTRNQA